MVQYLHFRILEFQLTKRHNFWGISTIYTQYFIVSGTRWIQTTMGFHLTIPGMILQTRRFWGVAGCCCCCCLCLWLWFWLLLWLLFLLLLLFDCPTGDEHIPGLLVMARSLDMGTLFLTNRFSEGSYYMIFEGC